MLADITVGMIEHLNSFLDSSRKKEVAQAVREVIKDAPLYRPTMPFGAPFKYLMTNCGKLGWTSDERGFRYVAQQVSGEPWPPIPQEILSVVEQMKRQGLVPTEFRAESCLVNWYKAGDTLGLHQDKTEKNYTMPIISISLGAESKFVIDGDKNRANRNFNSKSNNDSLFGDKQTNEYWLNSGDVVVFGGQNRMDWHGIPYVSGKNIPIVKEGRINLTIRQVNN